MYKISYPTKETATTAPGTATEKPPTKKEAIALFKLLGIPPIHIKKDADLVALLTEIAESILHKDIDKKPDGEKTKILEEIEKFSEMIG